MNKHERLKALLAEASRLYKKGETGSLSKAEVARCGELATEIDEMKAAIRIDEETRAAIKGAMSDEQEHEDEDEPDIDGDPADHAKKARSRRTLTHPLAKAVSRALAKRGSDGKAAVLSGGTVAVAFDAGISQQPQDTALICQRVTWFNQDSGDKVTFLRQTTKVAAAVAVPVGEPKPEATLSLERIEQAFVTLSHLFTVPKQWLDDSDELERIIQDELTNGVLYGVDDLLVNGTEDAEDGSTVGGILTTTGVQTQAFTTNALTSIALAIQKCRDANHTPTLIALSPTDWTTIQLLQATGSGQFLMSGLPNGQGFQQLFGVPVMISPRLEVGVAVVGDFSSGVVEMFTRGPIEIQSNPFIKSDENKVQIRVEGRFTPVIGQPAGFVVTALNAEVELSDDIEDDEGEGEGEG